MGIIALQNGGEVLVDDADVERLNHFKWWATKNRNGIIAMSNMKIDGRWKAVRLHTFLLNPTNGLVVDHINHNTLDNRRINLRICTPQQNRFNSRPTQHSKSGQKGVTLQDGKWRVRFRVNGKSISLGMFSSLDEATRVYKKEIKNYHKEFTYNL